ncbi:S8 family serine peptidase [Effusibacillus consociatus]|uniref:S8 family serine peptidase n=1 Tax=Effusibacillus consociatus TaxID=1117041 RepID=A0ABV9Q4U4_9BACL
MKKRLVALTMSSVLALSLLAGIQGGANAQEEKSYLVSFKGNLPVDYQAQIQQAGGAVTRTIAEVGIVEAASNNPSFLPSLRSNPEIEAADEEIELYLEDDPQADEAGSKTFVPGTTNAWDQNGHGTHVAGSIAGSGKVLGVGPNLKVRAYRVFGATGGAKQSWITDTIVSAANDGVEVVNMSLGGWRWLAHNLDDKGPVCVDGCLPSCNSICNQKGSYSCRRCGERLPEPEQSARHANLLETNLRMGH